MQKPQISQHLDEQPKPFHPTVKFLGMTRACSLSIWLGGISWKWIRSRNVVISRLQAPPGRPLDALSLVRKVVLLPAKQTCGRMSPSPLSLERYAPAPSTYTTPHTSGSQQIATRSPKHHTPATRQRYLRHRLSQSKNNTLPPIPGELQHRTQRAKKTQKDGYH